MKRLYIVGFFLVLIFGSFLHFSYDLSGESKLVAVFSSVNESTFEHLKLFFWPYVFFTIFERLKCGYKKNFVFVKMLSLFFGMAVIVTVFYAYTAVLGKNYLILDILTFCLGDAAAFILSSRLL